MHDRFCDAVVKDGKIRAEWTRSWMLSIYKGKGEAVEWGSHTDIKLRDVLERVLETKIRNRVKVVEMQFGFFSGKGTVSVISYYDCCSRSNWSVEKSCDWHLSILIKHLTVPREVVI